MVNKSKLLHERSGRNFAKLGEERGEKHRPALTRDRGGGGRLRLCYKGGKKFGKKNSPKEGVPQRRNKWCCGG